MRPNETFKKIAVIPSEAKRSRGIPLGFLEVRLPESRNLPGSPTGSFGFAQDDGVLERPLGETVNDAGLVHIVRRHLQAHAVARR